MTQITEALEAARAHILDAYRIWQADDVSAVPPPKSGAGAVIAKIDAVLSSLPIAGEGKVKTLVWEPHSVGMMRAESVLGRYVAHQDGVWWLGIDGRITKSGQTIDTAMAAAQDHYQNKILSALNSSPGKDGGQEVEAAEWQGRYWIEDEGRWSNWITNPVGYPWAYDLQEGKSEIRYLYPQPASSALVEAETLEALCKLTFAVQHSPNCPSAWLVRLPGKSGAIDMKPYADGLGMVQHQTGDVLGFGKTFGEAARSALSASQSTSREGER